MIPPRALFLPRLVSLLACLFTLQFAEAQAPDTIHGRTFEPYDIFISGGKFSRLTWHTRQDYFARLVSKSTLIGVQLLDTGIVYLSSSPSTSLTQGLYVPKPPSDPVYLNAGFTIKLRDNEDRDVDGPWLKLGLSYFGHSALMSGGVFRTTRKAADSLYFIGSQAVHRDSVRLRSLEFYYRHRSLNLEGTFYYQVNHRGILSLFGGAGLMAGINYGGEARVKLTEELAVYDTIDVSAGKALLYEKTYDRTATEERYDIRSSLSLGLSLSIGMNMRLASHYPFFRNLHAFAEYKPMFRADLLPRVPVQSVVMSIYCAGLRYEFP